MIDRKKLKADARQAMREAKPHPFWVTLAVSVILAVLIALSGYISGSYETYRELFRQVVSGELMQSIMSDTGLVLPSGSTSGFGSFLVLALEIMASVISVGYVLYCLRISRHIHASVGDVFDAFGLFLRAIIIRILRSLILFLWAMLFALALSFLITAVILGTILLLYNTPDESPDLLLAVMNSPWFFPVTAVLTYIPLIVVSYFYRLADYFMLDNPGMSCFQCLTMSRMAMRGRKWQLFKLDLSFIGWYILSVVPFVALWVQPYVTITEAGFYSEVSPLFMQDMEQKLRARQEAMRRPPDNRGYHVPGQDRNEDEQ